MNKNYQHISIEEEDDIIYPLTCELFENPEILYHGTSSCYTAGIEQNGWHINDQPYDIIDIKNICEFFEELDYRGGGYSKLRPYTLGMSDSRLNKKEASFTSNYWMARGFASIIGGETIRALFESISAFKQLNFSDEMFENHIKHLKKEFERYKHLINNIKRDDANYLTIRDNYDWFKTAIKKMRDKEFMETALEKMNSLEAKYHPFVDKVYGIVYVLKIKPEWFKNWNDNYLKEAKTDFFTKEDIGPNHIIARIDFPNGIIPYTPASNIPLPLPWALDIFKDYISSNELIRKYHPILNKYIS